jgi:hypothetical protein
MSFSNASAGGDYGGGPKVIELMKQDTHISLNDLKLTKDKEFVELTVAYRKVRTRINPLLTEEENKKLRLGKFTAIKYKYDKSLFSQRTIDKLKKRKRFVLFKKKYKKLARRIFEIEEIKKTDKNATETRFYEVRFK